MEPNVDDILALAAIICKVDGAHKLGAAALAEAILSHPDCPLIRPTYLPTNDPDNHE